MNGRFLLNFIATQHAILLQKQGLDTFEKVWDTKIHWLEPPNTRRGGWSGVGRILLQDGLQERIFYVKKQCNYKTQTLRHPLSGEPTFAKEFRILRYLRTRGIQVPDVAFYAEKYRSEGLCAVLITENLSGYVPLSQFLMNGNFDLLASRQVLRSVALAVKRFHEAGIQHRALYTKHLFVKIGGIDTDVAIIDLEKARPIILPFLQPMADLAKLNYRTARWTKTARLSFFLSYLRAKKLNFFTKYVFKFITQKR